MLDAIPMPAKKSSKNSVSYCSLTIRQTGRTEASHHASAVNWTQTDAATRGEHDTSSHGEDDGGDEERPATSEEDAHRVGSEGAEEGAAVQRGASVRTWRGKQGSRKVR